MSMRFPLIPHLLLALAAAAFAQSGRDWPVYNGGADGLHASRLTQINRRNVARRTRNGAPGASRRPGASRPPEAPRIRRAA